MKLELRTRVQPLHANNARAEAVVKQSFPRAIVQRHITKGES
jgi:hypothetical protein